MLVGCRYKDELNLRIDMLLFVFVLEHLGT